MSQFAEKENVAETMEKFSLKVSFAEYSFIASAFACLSWKLLEQVETSSQGFIPNYVSKELYLFTKYHRKIRSLPWGQFNFKL